MKIFITGGAGCLGSNLVEHWLPRGYKLCVLDNFSTGKREVLPLIKNLNVVEGSIEDAVAVDNIISDFKPDVVINSAASYKNPDDWIADTQTNVIGPINIAKSCERNNVRQIINFQTALCYGRPIELPIPITHPTMPFTSYGVSKASGENYLLMSKVPTVSLRLANITGPRLAIGPIPTFYKRLKSGQSCFCSDSRRDFLDMEDFFSLMDKIILSTGRRGVYNVSTGTSHSIKEIFDLVVSHLQLPNQEVPIVAVGDDDVAEVVLDASETKIAFDWEHKYQFEDIIKRQLLWYDDFGVSDVFSHLKPLINR
jgi:UDP-glucose 4-epimerase